MDGVLVDNNVFHKKAYRIFCQKYGLELSDADFERRVFGRTNADVLRELFGPSLTKARSKRYENEKEALYRHIYGPHVKPLPGLKVFLDALRARGIPVAVATSAPIANVRFTLARTGLSRRFRAIVDARHVKKGKPEPDIFLKAALRLGRRPAECLVVEDSLAGLEAARRAGMRAVAVSTTHSKRELKPRSLRVIRDFRDLGPVFLRNF